MSDKDHDQKQFGGMGGLFGLHLLGHNPLREAYAGTQRKNLEARTETETREECYFSWLIWLFFSYSLGLTTSDNDPGGLEPPRSIINKENASTNLSKGQSDGGLFSVEIPSSQLTLAYVKLTN